MSEELTKKLEELNRGEAYESGKILMPLDFAKDQYFLNLVRAGILEPEFRRAKLPVNSYFEAKLSAEGDSIARKLYFENNKKAQINFIAGPSAAEVRVVLNETTP